MKFRCLISKLILPSPLIRRCAAEHGNILVYIVMTMVIFAVLGAAMVSLFSTSISSSATANESRRAFFLAEAGLRYGLSELRKVNGFTTSNIATLNDTLYKMPPSGDFDITVFGAWFKSPSNQSLSGGALSVEIDKGKIPVSFFEKSLPAAITDLYLVVASLDPRSPIQKPNPAEVAKVNGFSYTVGNYTSFTFDLADNFVVGKDKDICMAIKPLDGTFTPDNSSSYLDLNLAALQFFPKTDGSFQIGGRTYFYKTAKEESGAIRLSGITPGPGVSSDSVTVAESTDYILLAPNNYFITSKGTSASGQVTFGGDLDNSASLADHSYQNEPDIQLKISDVRQIEDNVDFISGGTDTQGDYLQIGPTTGMGVMWYNQNLYLGGATNYCTSTPDISSRVGCFFESGIRAYFTLEYSGTGDGLILALINGQLNQLASAGGDYAAPELLGYAGDSRTNNAGGFLDTTGLKGLRPPKMGLELDAKRNWDPAFEAKPVNFCDGNSITSGLKTDTRNDPDPASATKDFVQYVYWGNDSLNVPCRTTPTDRSSTYDDNRHNPGGTPTSDWFQPLSGVVNTSAAVSADGKTIYVASNNSDTNPTIGWLYAIELDAQGYPVAGSGTPFFTGSDGITAPVVDSSGNIYVGSGNKLYAFRPNLSQKSNYPYTLPLGNRASKPVIGGDDTIYVSAYDGVKFGYLYAIQDGSLKSGWGVNNPQVIQFFNNAPVLTPYDPNDPNDLGRLVIAATTSQRVYALRASDGLPDTNWGLSGVFIAATPKNPPGVGPGATAKGTVYVGGGDRRVYALSGEDGSTLLTSPVIAADGLATQPVVAGGAVYVGSLDDHLYALNTSDLSPKTGFPFLAAGDVQSTPFIDSNGTLYFGSDLRDPFADNQNVNALYSDGTVKWRYSTDNKAVRGTPLVRPDGTVYIGSFNSNLYAINQFAVPKGLKDKSITYKTTNSVGGCDPSDPTDKRCAPADVDNSDDWLKSKKLSLTEVLPWAVRLEIYRNTTPNVSAPIGYFGYQLRTWVRQCQKADCSDVSGSFYADTRLIYSPALRPPQMEQIINLSPTENTQFQRFIFGFTSQTASGDNQRSLIRDLKLSFVRATDPTIICDPNWPESTTCP